MRVSLLKVAYRISNHKTTKCPWKNFKWSATLSDRVGKLSVEKIHTGLY